MADLTVPELRQHIDSELPDAALARIIADVYDEIVAKYGPVGVDVSERVVSDFDRDGAIVLRRKPASITSIVEELDSVGDSTRTLDPTDYRVRGYTVQRLRGGVFPARGWSGYGTTVTYRPRDDSARRAMAVVDVAKEELAHSGFASRRLGDYSESKGAGQGGKTLDQARAEILRRRLAPKGGVVFA